MGQPTAIMQVALPPTGRMGRPSAASRISYHHTTWGSIFPLKAWQHQPIWQTPVIGILLLSGQLHRYDAHRLETIYACGNFTRALLWGDTHGRALAVACSPPLWYPSTRGVTVELRGKQKCGAPLLDQPGLGHNSHHHHQYRPWPGQQGERRRKLP